MRTLGLLLAFLLVGTVPGPASAQVKSIFRFEKEAKPSKQDGTAEKGKEAPGEGSGKVQGRPGSTRQVIGEEGEEGAARPPQAPEAPDVTGAFGLPGTPAMLAPPGVEAPAGPEVPSVPQAPPLVNPAMPGEAAARPLGATPRERRGEVEAPPALPEAPQPFVYERAPRSVGTVTGYDAAVAPPPQLYDPATPPALGAGQPGVRPLPRLAPYGYALPPGDATPPADRPR